MKSRIVQIVGSLKQERFRWILVLKGVSIFLGLLIWRKWPGILHRFFLVMVPVWIFVHIFLAALAEARLFLVPYEVILLPAAFLVLQGKSNEIK